jgi:GntR family transcriptional regulator
MEIERKTPRVQPLPDHEALVRHSAQPLYQQLAALLARRIDDGEFGGGRRLPTEPELMARHGVSRVTVRQAIGLLARNCRVVARRGKGTYVAAPMMSHDLGVLRGFYDALRDQGIEPRTELLEFAPGAGRADRALPEGLNLPVRLQRRYLLEDRPFALVVAWLPAQAAAIGEARAAHLTVYEIVEQFLGERVANADVAIRCEAAGRPIAHHLDIAAGSPVLVMERRSISPGGRLLEFMRIHILPERYEFRLRVPGALEIARAVRRTAGPSAHRR